MIDDGVITGKVLLEHIQGMKVELVQRIDQLDKKLDGVHVELEDARKHREALQEDLYETMRVQAKHGRKLTRLART